MQMPVVDVTSRREAVEKRRAEKEARLAALQAKMGAIEAPAVPPQPTTTTSEQPAADTPSNGVVIAVTDTDAAGVGAGAATATTVVSSKSGRALTLNVATSVVADIQPSRSVSYDQHTQTEGGELTEFDVGVGTSNADNSSGNEGGGAGGGGDRSFASPVNDEPAEPAAKEVAMLDDAAAAAILNSEDFRSFFDKSSKLVERVLDEPYDPLVDYAMLGSKGVGVHGGEDVDLLVHSHTFELASLTANRVVNDLNWSFHTPELLVAAYGEDKTDDMVPGGRVLVWNTHLKARPEFSFHCQSPVMRACTVPYNPALISGATYAGQLVIWDVRAGKATPIQRTPLSTEGHTHPVFYAQVLGSEHAHSLVSMSSDGRLCAWSLDMLASPQEVTELVCASPKRPTPVTAAGFPAREINKFVVGCEDGAVFNAGRHGSSEGLGTAYDPHAALVTSVDFHPPTGSANLSDLFLTSSMDWSARLWSLKSSRPLCSFNESNDAVYDARWSPGHPAVFATADGAGELALWNLNAATETPVYTVNPTEGNASLSKVAWQQPNGAILSAGSTDGRVHLYTVAQDICNPKADEGLIFAEETLHNIHVDEVV